MVGQHGRRDVLAQMRQQRLRHRPVGVLAPSALVGLDGAGGARPERPVLGARVIAEGVQALLRVPYIRHRRAIGLRRWLWLRFDGAADHGHLGRLRRGLGPGRRGAQRLQPPGREAGERSVRVLRQVVLVVARVGAAGDGVPESDLHRVPRGRGDRRRLRDGRRGRLGRGGRVQVDVLGRQRAVEERLLRAVGRLDHPVPDEAEHLADLHPRLPQRRDQRGGVGAVAGLAVLRHGAFLGGVGDQRVALGLDGGEAPPDGARGAGHLLQERVVAAGVQDHHAQRVGALDRPQGEFQRHRLEIHVPVGFERRVDRDQIVAPVHLDAVAGVVDDRDLGVGGIPLEALQRAQKLDLAEVLMVVDDEAKTPQHVGEVRGVVGGIGERGDIGVGGVADHQRALHRGGEGVRRPKEQGGRDESRAETPERPDASRHRGPPSDPPCVKRSRCRRAKSMEERDAGLRRCAAAPPALRPRWRRARRATGRVGVARSPTPRGSRPCP